MENITHLIVNARRIFGRVDYKPVNSIAKLFQNKRGFIPADKIEALKVEGFTVEEI